MDDLLKDFLTETNESLNLVDAELVRFEQEPNNGKILGNIFRLVHTIKGTCGFLALPRLETLAHAAETVMGKYRDDHPHHHRPHQKDPRRNRSAAARAGWQRRGFDRNPRLYFPRRERGGAAAGASADGDRTNR
jgi:HPt (histidine-containing phosphotransfer) domain-containing protein